MVIVYDDIQTRLWSRMVFNHLTPADLRDLGISEKLPEDKEQNTLLSQIDHDAYLYHGRMISNIGPSPAKFEKCYQTMETIGFDHCVVYSEFDVGTRAFVSFLKGRKMDSSWFDVLRPDAPANEKARILADFASGKIKVVVLGAGMYEGISFLKTRQMHILDSPTNFKNLAQLMGRVVRLHSHDDVAKPLVEYYHYTAVFRPSMLSFISKFLEYTAQTIKNKAAYMGEFLKLWKETKTFKQRLPGAYTATILETATAEALATASMRPLREMMVNLETKVASNSATLPKAKCCPVYEKGTTDPACSLSQCQLD